MLASQTRPRGRDGTAHLVMGGLGYERDQHESKMGLVCKGPKRA
jgi:hypothetical protein